MRGLAMRAAVAVALSLAAGCGAGGSQAGHLPPRDGQAGLQLSGSFGGRQLAISDGAPDLLQGAGCARRLGIAVELCFTSRDIDGNGVTVSFLNATVLQAGATLPVGTGDCRSLEECAAVTDVAVVELQVGDQRQRARSGRLAMGAVEAGERYAGTATLGFRDGRLGGVFDVVPRPEP